MILMQLKNWSVKIKMKLLLSSLNRLQEIWVVFFPQPGFLEGLRKICDEEKIVFIFDEVMTGFRLAQVVHRKD